MKSNILSMFATVVTLLIVGAVIAFSLVSCSDKKTDTAETTNADTTEYVTENNPDDTVDTASPLDTDTPEDERVPVDNKEMESVVKYQFEVAKEAAYFVIDKNMPIDYETYVMDEDSGALYYKVNDETTYEILDGKAIDSFSDLAEYLSAIFGTRFADSLIEEAATHYKDIDGALYCQEFDNDDVRKMDSAEFFLSKYSSKYLRYTAKVKAEDESSYDDESESVSDSESNGEVTTQQTPEDKKDPYIYYDYIFENNGKGWYWTAFPIF